MEEKNLFPFERIKREIITLKAERTDPKFGKRPETRTVEELMNFGIVNINKPQGPTSHQVSAYAKQILGINKAGHSGTLDPNVTGLLPTALGDATRVIHTLLSAGKEYVFLMHIHKPHTETDIRMALASFVGKIKQLPPIKSAIKREWRYRKIYYLEIIEIKDQDVLFRVGTQAGTYIRKLCHDVGTKLGGGAHMAELIRTRVGPFNGDNITTLQELSDNLHFYKEKGDETGIRKNILPIEFAVSHIPKMWVLDTTVNSLCHGSNLKIPGISKLETEVQIDEDIAIMSLKDELVAIGKLKLLPKDIKKQEKGIVVEVHKVFMEPNTYPRMDKA
jgi:H/ACA ribonucleoprotein complex subunit 4